MINFINIVLIIFFSLISGFADSKGFLYASTMWKQGHLVYESFIKSAIGFTGGIVSYWIVVKYLREVGVVSAEIQTLIWFATVIVGIALSSGQFFRWQIIDQLIGVGVIIGIGWLIFRTGG